MKRVTVTIAMTDAQWDALQIGDTDSAEATANAIVQMAGAPLVDAQGEVTLHPDWIGPEQGHAPTA